MTTLRLVLIALTAALVAATSVLALHRFEAPTVPATLIRKVPNEGTATMPASKGKPRAVPALPLYA